MKKILDKIYETLFFSKKDQKEDERAIQCSACRVWHLRVRDIIKAQFRKSLFSMLVNLFLIIITILALTGYLELFLDEVIKLFKYFY